MKDDEQLTADACLPAVAGKNIHSSKTTDEWSSKHACVLYVDDEHIWHSGYKLK